MIPTPTPTIAALDIETYGAFEADNSGRPLPRQTVFHPHRMPAMDGVHPSRIIQTVSLTLPTTQPPSPIDRWALASLTPGPTMVFQMSSPKDVSALCKWLSHLTALIGHNLLFDLSCLRYNLRTRNHLPPHHHFLIDTTVLNYLHNELRPEKSLKDLGPILSLFSYNKSESLKDGNRYPYPSHPSAISYNADDTHNTLLLAAHLCNAINRDWPSSPKATHLSLSFYSRTIHTCLAMMEAGICMDGTALAALESTQHAIVAHAREQAAACDPPLILDGEGSNKSQQSFINALFAAAMSGPNPPPPHLLAYTPTRKELSTSDLNRTILGESLPPSHPLLTPLAHLEAHASASKLISAYTKPLLHSKTSGPKDRRTSSCLIPLTPDRPSLTSQRAASIIWPKARSLDPLHIAKAPRALAFPSIYMIPSVNKDGQGDAGGQQQIRLSFTSPGATTFPSIIKDTYTSRFGSHGTIISADASQIELRMAGLLSGEPSILTPYQQGLDLHTLRAIQILEEVGKDPSHEQTLPTFRALYRQCGKHANFTDLNLGGPDVLQKTIRKKGGLDVPRSFCEAIVASRRRARPILSQWQDSLISQVRQQGYLILPITGVSRYLTGADAPNIVNFPVQAHAAAVTIEVANRLSRLLAPHNTDARPQCLITLVVYDAIYFDCLTSFLPTLRELLATSVRTVAESEDGYWHRLQAITGHTCPLLYDITE